MKTLDLFIIFISLPARVEETVKLLYNKLKERGQNANHNQTLL